MGVGIEGKREGRGVSVVDGRGEGLGVGRESQGSGEG